MQQNSVGSYGVGKDEKITVEMIAIATANTCSFVIDTASQVVLEEPRTYEFRVTVSAGNTHFAETRGAFHGPPPSDPTSDPRFEVFFTGSFGGGRFTGPVIRRSDPDHMCDITFERP